MLRISSRRSLRFVVALALLLGACSKDVKGPEPELAAPSKTAMPAPVQPGIVCNAQQDSTVTLHGEDFSPVPIDVPNDPKLALPTITLSRAHELDGRDVTNADAVVWSGDPDKDPTNAYTEDGKTPLVAWKSRQEMSFTVTQSLLLPEGTRGLLPQGVYDVEVKNANGAKVASVGALAVVNKPELTATTPSIVCLDEADQDVRLTGTTFLELEGKSPVLSVEGAAPERALALAECDPIEHEGITASRCAQATVTLDRGSVAAGYPALTVENPETAACHTEEAIHLRVVKKPTIDRVGPPLGCIAEEKRIFVVEGSGFLTIDGVLPTATIANVDVTVDAADGCQDLETMGNEVQICTSLTVSVDKGAVEPGLHPLVVRNPDPAGCSATAEGAVRIVPPPSIGNVVPPIVCLDDGEREITIEGEDFLIVDGTVPLVTIDGMALAPTAIVPAGCDDLETPELDVQRCDTVVVTLAKDSVGLGMPDITIENPEPAGCADARGDLLTVLAGPRIASATPALVCSEDMARAITILGTGFAKFAKINGDLLPTVTIGGTTATVDAITDCTTVMAHGLPTETCTALEVTVAQGALDTGNPEVVVVNPDPAGCSAASADVLVVPPLLAITMLEPVNVCVGAADTALPVTVSGQGFLRADSTDFTVTYNGNPITPADVTDCTALELPEGSGFTSVTSCHTITLEVDLTGLTGVGGATIPIEISNAHVASCPLTTTLPIYVVAPPTVTDAAVVENPGTPQNACSDTTFTLLITGTDFVSGAVVRLENDNGTLVADTVEVTSATSLTATFDDGVPYDANDPDYDVIVENAGACASPALADWIVIDPTPLVFFVDPPIVYNEITTDATVFTSGLTASSSLAKIELIGPDDPMGAATELTVVSNAKLNRIVARIPGIDGGSGQPTFDVGEYGVRVTTTLGCVGALDGGLTVKNALDDTLLTAITPSFVSPTKPTAVTVSGAGFLAVPRLYLTPAGGTGNAVALRSVEVVSGTQLTAIVPGNAATPLTDGAYDLVAVNPDGKIDVLASSVTITSGEPPAIESVVPASLAQNENLTTDVAVHGVDFDAAAVELECKETPTAATSEIVAGVIQGTPTSTDAVVRFNVNASGLAAGSICLLRLTNTDGARTDYSALSLTNSSYNLSSWQDSTGLTMVTDMTVARRAVSLAAGRPTTSSRFLYAVGGDSGAAGNTRTIGTLLPSVEAASVDVFGAMGDWSLQRNDLSQCVIGGVSTAAPRTAAGSARVGRFVYVVGGYQSGTTTATDTLLRAQVLDPLAAPEIDDLDAQLGDLASGTPGLSEGLYYYRVAAIFAADDASNPAGESLPGELLPVQLPEGPDGPGGDGILLTLTWQPIVGAHGYRIYRSPVAGAAVNDIELLAEKTCGTVGTDLCDCTGASDDCELLDDGTLTTTPGETPMPRGSLGVFHAVDGGARCTSTDCALSTARESLATAAVQDPTDPTKSFLYAFGGRDDAGAYLDTYEVATVTVAGDGSQTVSDWVAGGDTLASPRAELGVWVLRAENSSIIRASGTPDDVWLFVGGGRTTGGTLDQALDAALLQIGGGLSNFTPTDDLMNALAGFGAGASNDYLYTFGGQSASANGTSWRACAAAGGGCSGPLPDLKNPTAEGGATTERQYHGTTQESAFFFVAGGHDGTNTLATVERTVQ